ncbi:MAG: GNAT family N-acetyltransferase [Marinilabiliales bacterium]|nr:MAG: GNAT family N-acetyltransferase [Marinilabiliales bacterium]
MLEYLLIKSESDFTEKLSREEYVDFLFTHLERFGDPKKDINACIDYAFSDSEYAGGFCLAAFYEGKMAGALIMNDTGMKGYIPENILVYVAVDGSLRGKGLGRQIVEKAISMAEGNVKLHVEYDNPAKRLYERIGFKSKYAEMRYDK